MSFPVAPPTSAPLADLPSSSLSSVQLQSVYRWIDSIPLSKPKKNIARDFSDATLVAEVVAHFLPRMVELHNYSASNSIAQKHYNWQTLNQRVFRRLGFAVSTQEIENICLCKKGAIERLLLFLMKKLEEYQDKKRKQAAAGGAQEEEKYASEAAASGGAVANSGAQGKGAHHGAVGGVENLHTPQAKDILIADLKETVDILTLKVAKLEQLLRLKNSKIATLTSRVEDLEGK